MSSHPAHHIAQGFTARLGRTMLLLLRLMMTMPVRRRRFPLVRSGRFTVVLSAEFAVDQHLLALTHHVDFLGLASQHGVKRTVQTFGMDRNAFQSKDRLSVQDRSSAEWTRPLETVIDRTCVVRQRSIGHSELDVRKVLLPTDERPGLSVLASLRLFGPRARMSALGILFWSAAPAGSWISFGSPLVLLLFLSLVTVTHVVARDFLGLIVR